jgi:hypothetical protein
MSLADDLVKLEELRRTGALTEEEFATAKGNLLAGESPTNDAAERLGQQLAEVRYQNELARLDREWANEKEKYMLTGRYGLRYLPTAAMGWGTAVFGGAFGVFWVILAVAITSGMPDSGDFGVVRILFPVIGGLLPLGAVVFGIYIVRRAEAYNRALAAYQARRAAVKPEDFR